MKNLCEVDLIGVGAHHTRQGMLETHASDLQHFIDSFRHMTAKGILIPMFWGHQMKRGGPIHADDRATQRALWTAGWVHDIRHSPDDHRRLRVFFPPPPGMTVDPETRCLVNPVKHTQIREVSAGIGDWKDGTGQWWENVIVHVALTPLPVWLGQTGVGVYDACEKMIALSAESTVRVHYVLGGYTMPATMTAKKKGVPDEDEDTLPPEGEGADETPTEVPEEAPESMPTEEPPVDGDPNAATPNEQAGEPDGDEENPMDDGMEGEPGEETEPEEAQPFPLVEALAEMGIEMDEGTTAENFVERFAGVIAGLRAAGAKITVGGEHELAPVAAMNKATTETAPLFTLSTDEPELREQNPVVRAALTRVAKDARQKRRDRVELIVQKGLPSVLLDRVRSEITQVHLSLDGDDIAASMPDADKFLDFAESVADHVAPLLKATLSTGDAAIKGNPIPSTLPRRETENTITDEKAHRHNLKALAEKVYGPGVKLADEV